MLIKRTDLLSIAIALVFFVAACGAAEPITAGIAPATTLPPPSPTASRDNDPDSSRIPAPTIPPAVPNVRVEDPNEYRFSPLLPFDGIPPVYEPRFANAGEAPLQDDELVIGIAFSGEAKAYPITVLRSREMVNDELGGIPILVTW